ncbi:hypothetical protein Back2_15520 [Nocardioides baekrokdamisoli]|uniref:Antitoxin n=1 Tax=Nocardioides baekrokdamisoli TaxID=1804624 RepID=A0A3G9IMN4_9ACTN|nr:type II toxin-antitoxin system prevent-host-death family antitoxin [Nocardioides baekrokdamisoli]BBH17265.1 hypothetical protein Back2_15520 [Nocardioides baekrokdamisoli]
MTAATVGAYEAKTHLPALLARVEAGETVTITRHGHPVAKLVPISDVRMSDAEWEALLARRSTTKVLNPGETMRDLIHEGHRV